MSEGTISLESHIKILKLTLFIEGCSKYLNKEQGVDKHKRKPSCHISEITSQIFA